MAEEIRNPQTPEDEARISALATEFLAGVDTDEIERQMAAGDAALLGALGLKGTQPGGEQ
jgi:hypothetical protein